MSPQQHTRLWTVTLACAVGGGCSSSGVEDAGGGGASAGTSTSSSSTTAPSTAASSGAGASTADGGGSGAGGTSTATGTPAVCGNGVREPGEACDGDDFGGLSCADLFSPMATGTLGCNTDCTLDGSACGGVGWPQTGFAGHNRRQSPNVGGNPNPACSWSPADGTWYGVAVVGADGTLYSATSDPGVGSDVSAYAPDGARLWTSAAAIYPEALDPTGTVLYARSLTGLSALDAMTGSELWSLSIPSYSAALDVRVAPDGTIVAYSDKSFKALSAAGTELWSLPPDQFNLTYVGAAVDASATTYALSSVGGTFGLHAIDPSGAVTLEVPVNYGQDPIFAAPALGIDGTVYFGISPTLYAYSRTGTLLWSHDTGQDFGEIAIAADGTIYAGIVAVTPSGVEKWRYDYGELIQHVALGGDGTLYASSDGFQYFDFYALDGATGTVKDYFWALDPSGGFAIGLDGAVWGFCP